MSKFMQKNLEKVYAFIKDFRYRFGYSPSIREIQKNLKFKSTSSVHLYLKKLKNQGLIFINGKNISRSIDLPQGQNKDDFIILNDYNSKNNTYKLSKSLFPDAKPPLFVFTMNSNDFRSQNINKDDLLILQKQNHASICDLILCKLHDNAKIYRYNPNGEMVNLVSDSENFEVYPSDIFIMGKVIGVLRTKI